VKCFYCDFAAFSGQSKTARRYLSALEREAGLMPERTPSTLYIGGGTPSELSCEEISLLFDCIGKAYPRSRFVETTFEGNPESLDGGKLKLLRERGTTRLSIGLQTCDDSLLKSIGRRHSADDFFRIYREARAVGGMDLSVDLMYGLPGQSLESLLHTLDSVLALEPEHLSLYGLQVEDRTLFAKRGVEPDEDLGREMFEAALERISRAGLRHYEISNFALPGHESCHNMLYWDGQEYIGLGCAAASFLDGERSTNSDKLQEYCGVVEQGRRPIAETETASGLEKLGEEAFLGLRKIDGFVPGAELEREFAASWATLSTQGLVERAHGRRRLTRQGVFLANEAFSHFVPPFSDVGRAEVVKK
jgi:oxygen-independent coproporphyrinogen-3 oxidase